MTKEINIKNLHIIFVLRHRYEKELKKGFNYMFREWKIGVWFRKDLIVGKKDFNIPKKWKDGLVRNYQIGFDVLWAKMWIEIDFGGMHIKEK